MYISGANKFTYPLLIQRGYMSTVSRRLFSPSEGKKSFFQRFNWFKQEKKVLGRWNLKHNEKELNQFCQYLPDPGYPNTYHYPNITLPTISTTIVMKDSSTQYTHSGKMQN